MTPGAIMNLISRDKFPVPTYKLGKKRVIDLAVLRAFFEAKKAEGLSAREIDKRLIERSGFRRQGEFRPPAGIKTKTFKYFRTDGFRGCVNTQVIVFISGTAAHRIVELSPSL
jgi:hypothetical protein